MSDAGESTMSDVAAGTIVRSTARFSAAEQSFFRRLSEPKIPSLDGVRAIAVFLVLYYHMQMSPLFNGPMGVLIFFTLSGFLITWLLLKEYDRSGDVSLSGFYKRRSLRIFPAAYCFLAFIAIVDSVRHTPIQWSQWWTSFFYVSNYQHAVFRPSTEYIMHTWSLGVEEQFYLLWPSVFLICIRRGTMNLMRLLVVAIGAIWLFRAIVWLGLHKRDYLSYSFESRADALLVGCLFAVLLSRRVALNRLLPLLRLSPFVGMGALALSAVAEYAIGNNYRFTVGLAVEPIFTALWLGQLIYHAETGLGQLLNTKVVVYLGTISYPLYLYHGIGTWAAKPFSNVFMQMLVAALGAIAAASVSYWLVETRFLALKNKPVRLWFRRLSPRGSHAD
jgi:peptidoglycan/LPS O-acetylase OafA/YrhL